MPPNFKTSTARSFQFWLLALFLVLAILTGGTSRFDAQSLIVLRPLSVLVCAVALMTIRRDQIRGRGWIVSGFGAMLLLAALHLVPLPPGIWQSLPGRSELVDIDHIVGLTAVWRPLTLTPVNGWHSLSSLAAPLAVLLLGIQLRRDELYNLLPLMIGLGALSGFLGLLQVIGGMDGPLYFYRITNNGSAVGLFANRNHAALLLACMFPMLAVFASLSSGTDDAQQRRQMLAGSMAIILVPLILVTGSRSGMFLSVAGLIAAAIFYRRPELRRARRRETRRFQFGAGPLLGGLAVICLVFLTVFFSRAEAIERLFSQGSSEDDRLDIWTTSLDLVGKYFPWGSGSGSFVEAYQIVEPMALLDSTYLNRAHNDWIEIAVTFGLPGLSLLAIAAFFYLRRTYRLWRSGDGKKRSVTFSRMAGILMAMIAAGSISDYPLRTPAIMCVFAVLVLWFIEAGRETGRTASSNEHLS